MFCKKEGPVYLSQQGIKNPWSNAEFLHLNVNPSFTHQIKNG